MREKVHRCKKEMRKEAIKTHSTIIISLFNKVRNPGLTFGTIPPFRPSIFFPLFTRTAALGVSAPRCSRDPPHKHSPFSAASLCYFPHGVRQNHFYDLRLLPSAGICKTTPQRGPGLKKARGCILGLRPIASDLL